jgi:glycine cleavage system aminomethyltransferase T/ABC-type branched-subunit amino acid transport system substrate-binding protein
MTIDVRTMRSTPPGYFTVRWGLPEYTDWIDESMSWKETCYIGDWSFLWERRFRGPDVLKLFSDISVNSFAKFDIGRSKHVIHTNQNGKVIHEGILSRLDTEEFLLFGRGCFWADYNLRHGKYKASSEPDDLFNLQVSGPNAIYLLEKACGQSLRDVKFMHSGKIKISGVEMLALRQGMAGEIGFELQGPIKFREQVSAAVMEAGKEFGIRKLGGRAVFINHLEACFPTIITDYCPAMFDDDMEEYRAEFQAAMPGFATTFNIAGSFEGNQISDWYRSPVELGWGKNVKFDHDFIGRKALEPEVANPKRLMRTLVWNADDVVDVYASMFRDARPCDYMDMPRDQRGFMYADKVIQNGKVVGVSTSRGYSYYFREMLSLCTLDVACCEPGSEVMVIWGNPCARPTTQARRSQPAAAKTGPAVLADGVDRRADRKNGEEHMLKSALLLGAALALGPGPAVAQNKSVKIGFVSTFSGPTAVMGNDMRNSFELALDHLGRKMGGVPVEVIYEDDQQRPDVGKQKTDKLIESEKVDFIVGYIWSNVLLASIKSAVDSKTFLITSNAGPHQIAGEQCSPYIFSTSWQNDQTPAAVGLYMNQKGVKTAFLLGPNYAAGKDMLAGVASTFGQELTKWPDQLDFSVELAKARGAKPDAIFAFYPGASGAQFLIQYLQSGLKDQIPLYTAFTIDKITLPRQKEAAVGIPGAQEWVNDLPNEQNKRFVDDYRKKHPGLSPTFYGAQTYDAAMLINAAVVATKGDLSDKEAVRKAMEKADFESVRGKFRFGNNHIPIQDFYLQEAIKDGDGYVLKTVATIVEDSQDRFHDQCPMK